MPSILNHNPWNMTIRSLKLPLFKYVCRIAMRSKSNQKIKAPCGSNRTRLDLNMTRYRNSSYLGLIRSTNQQTYFITIVQLWPGKRIIMVNDCLYIRLETPNNHFVQSRDNLRALCICLASDKGKFIWSRDNSCDLFIV